MKITICDPNYYRNNYLAVYGVGSESNPNTTYTVALKTSGEWSCSCPHWTRNASRPPCKHVRLAMSVRAGSDIVPQAPIPEKARKHISSFSQIELD